jgi:hypothetical protein
VAEQFHERVDADIRVGEFGGVGVAQSVHERAGYMLRVGAGAFECPLDARLQWRARKFLDEFDRQGGVQPPESVVQQGCQLSAACEALWLAALGSTMKCFQHSESRSSKLNAESVFGPDTTQGVRATFDLLKNLRNKHVLHDENDWMQAIPLAIVGTPGHEPVVSDIDWMVMEGTDTAHIGQLGTVVNAALAWINREIDAQIEVIRADLLARSYEDLIALPGAASGTTPYTGSVGQRRR